MGAERGRPGRLRTSFASSSSRRASPERPSSSAISASVSSPAATREEAVLAPQPDGLFERAPALVAAAQLVPPEAEMPDRIRLQQCVAVFPRPVVGGLEVGQRAVVLVADDLVDDPDPELGPALEALVVGLACQLEGAAEELELARILLAL